MSSALVLREAAFADIDAAEGWYESKEPGLGGRFVDEVDRTLALIVENPGAYAVVDVSLLGLLRRRRRPRSGARRVSPSHESDARVDTAVRAIAGCCVTYLARVFARLELPG